MNKDMARGKWAELKGNVKAKVAKLKGDDIGEAKGKVQEVAGKVQKTYGDAKEKVKDEYNDLKKAK